MSIFPIFDVKPDQNTFTLLSYFKQFKGGVNFRSYEKGKGEQLIRMDTYGGHVNGKSNLVNKRRNREKS